MKIISQIWHSVISLHECRHADGLDQCCFCWWSTWSTQSTRLVGTRAGRITMKIVWRWTHKKGYLAGFSVLGTANNTDTVPRATSILGYVYFKLIWITLGGQHGVQCGGQHWWVNTEYNVVVNTLTSKFIWITCQHRVQCGGHHIMFIIINLSESSSGGQHRVQCGG